MSPESVHPPRRGRAALALVLITMLLAAGCGPDPRAQASDRQTDLTPAAARGKAIVAERGCASCHGAQGEGLVGPSWIGLAGSEVTLDDGRVVVVDADYLRAAITDPARDTPVDSVGLMPAFDLGADELDDVVAYLESLS